jgi:hypothetical protein
MSHQAEGASAQGALGANENLNVPTLTLTLGFNGELALVQANGRLCPLREGFAEQVILRLLRGQSWAKAQAPSSAPQYIPRYEYEAITQVRKFTLRGREIPPDVSLSDLEL